MLRSMILLRIVKKLLSLLKASYLKIFQMYQFEFGICFAINKTLFSRYIAKSDQKNGEFETFKDKNL